MEKIYRYGWAALAAAMAGDILVSWILPLLLSLLSYKGGESGIAALGAVSFAPALISFVLFVMSDKDSFAGTVIDNEGIWERLCLIFMYLPLFAECIHARGQSV